MDVEGQAIASDLKSGRSEDKLAFVLSLQHGENLYLRAARPNEWKQWVELLEKVCKNIVCEFLQSLDTIGLSVSNVIHLSCMY